MSYGIYRNCEGYSDPTAGVAMSNIIRDERKQKKKELIKLHGKERRRLNRRLKRLREAQQQVIEEAKK